MIMHTFICDDCGTVVEDHNTKKIHRCPKCSEDMRWDLNFNAGQRGDYNHISDSLAISPSQIQEHRKKFPGVDVLPDGRIHFTSVRQRGKYIDKTGFEKVPQKLKPKKAMVKRT